MHESKYLGVKTHEMFSWGGSSIAEMAPICVGVATTKCNALREVGGVNLVERAP
jgi:hypothetical protein